MPGMTKICSMMTAPPMRSGAWRPISVTTGMSALRSAWRVTTGPLAQPLRPRGPDVVLAQHLEHHRACQAHGERRQRGAEDDAGHDHLGEVLERILAERHVLELRRPAPPHRREHHHQRAQPEAGDGEHQDGEGAREIVAGGVLADRRVDADRERDGERRRSARADPARTSPAGAPGAAPSPACSARASGRGLRGGRRRPSGRTGRASGGRGRGPPRAAPGPCPRRCRSATASGR